MLKKMFKVFFGMVALLALAAACWAATVFAGWPLWYTPLLFIAALITFALMEWAIRRWHGWRLRQRMQRTLPKQTAAQTIDIDKSWNHGVRTLRQSRLGRMGSALYALPWFLMLGDSGSGKSTLLTRSGLSTPLRPVGRGDAVPSTDALEWWYFERAVIIDTAGNLLKEGSAWKRLLYWLLRSRRREPLNGIIQVIDIQRLQNDSKEQLAETGQRLRRHLDDLVKVFGARLPVYLVLTGAERLPGMLKWGAGMSKELREQPFGLLSSQQDTGAEAFLDEIFSRLNHRLADLRIVLGQRTQPDPDVLHFPEQIAALQPALERLMLPAFANNPYSEPPLLAGLFITAEAKDEEGLPEGWFSRGLLGRLLPEQRYAYHPIDNWRHWRRLLAHAAVIIWLGSCGIAGILMWYGNEHVRGGLALAAQQRPSTINFTNNITQNIEALRRYHQFVENLTNYDKDSWKRWLPFHNRLMELIQHERAGYVTAFNSYLQQPLFADLLTNNLPIAAASNDDNLIAAYTESLVRRINLIDARLANRPLDNLHGPEDELLPLFQRFLPSQMPSLSQAESLSDSYKAWLTWQNDPQFLRAERAHALHQLDSLGLGSRPLSWLEAWAEQQSRLPKIRYSDYMQDSDQPDASLPRAYTAEGQRAILEFIDELSNATRNESLWKDQRERFLIQYQNDTQDAWFRFIEGYLLVDQQRMASEAEWREILAVIGTSNAPYRRLLQRSAQRFALIPAAQRTPWANLSIRLNRLLMLADDPAIQDENSLLSHLRIANKVGSSALKSLASTDSVSQSMKDLNNDMSQAKTMSQFEQQLHQVSLDMQKSDAQAFQVALDSWGFGSDPAVKSSALWEANDLRNNLQSQMQSGDPRESVVWVLATGGVEFAMAYAGEIAACRFQQDWNGQILGAVEGVKDPALMDNLLYGDRGQLTQFLNGPIKTFIQRNAQGYSPRMALNQNIPLTNAFYAYVSYTQHAQTDMDSAKRESIALQTSQQADKQMLQATQKSLQAQLDVLQQQIPKLQASKAVVTIQATPPSINAGAAVLPQQTRLTLQCNNGSTTLENYNFPTSTSFIWAPDSCNDVSLEIRFPNYTLAKHWSGARGFIDFLRTFAGGQHTFTSDDFPDQRGLMSSDKVTSLTLTYRQQGEKELLNNYQQADTMQTRADVITEQLQRIASQLAAIEAQALNNSVGIATNGDPAQQQLAAMTPPAQIGWCWTARPNPLPDPVVAPTDEVVVGIFNGSQQVKDIRSKLESMGFNSRQENLPEDRVRVVVTGLDGPEARRQAIERINQQLNLQSRALPDNNGNSSK